MIDVPDIISIAHGSSVMLDGLELLHEREKQIPGTWQYDIRRYRKLPKFSLEDTGMLAYHYHPADPDRRYLELTFCITGDSYCHDRDTDCDACRELVSKSCEHRMSTIDVLRFRFAPPQLASFVKTQKKKSQAEALLSFTHAESFYRAIPLSGKMQMALSSIIGNTYTDTIENIFINAQTQILLLYTFEGMYSTQDEEEVPACKFLENALDREKIVRAREILISHIGDPITIKELSRKVAINECYLKKGFKVMFGSTIFDFYQDQRMEHARYLLYQKGMNVSEVSAYLGYSSISHFSTAFKKHTGIKPCELLSK